MKAAASGAGPKAKPAAAPSLSKAKDDEGHYWFALKGPLQGPPNATLARDAGKRAKQKAAKGAAAAPAKDKDAEEKPDSAG